jgi:hypothetical protein
MDEAVPLFLKSNFNAIEDIRRWHRMLWGCRNVHPHLICAADSDVEEISRNNSSVEKFFLKHLNVNINHKLQPITI